MQDIIGQHFENLKNDTRVKDINMRLRWDILYTQIVRENLPPNFICEVLYAYLTDTHIDTALKKIIPERNCEFSHSTKI